MTSGKTSNSKMIFSPQHCSGEPTGRSPETTNSKGTRVTNRAGANDQTGHSGTEREGKYLTFSLREEQYGIGILKVKEIIGMMRITPVPQTPGYVKGVINLRGKVIPVIDLRLRFGMEPINYGDRTCIVVVEIEDSSGKLHTGIVVDSVSEVLNIKGSDIEDTPAFGTSLNTEYILGMAKTGGGVNILLDVDCALKEAEVVLVNLDEVA